MGTLLSTPCRFFMGNRDKDGYGIRGTGERVHRWIWEQINGPIPDGMKVLHRCDNPPCFRYDHLFLGTTAENNADRKAKGRSGRRRRKTKLTDEQVREIRRIARDQPWRRQTDVAAEFGVSEGTLSLIVNRKRIYLNVRDES